jgi:hypothetical protein
MALLGVQLTLWIGPTVPVPAPRLLSEALQSVEVTHSDTGRSGFQITFQAGRGGLAGMLDYPLLSSPLLRPFNRVILLVTLHAIPRVLMDGIITHQQGASGAAPGAGVLTVTGEDVSVMMDLEEKIVEHPAQPEPVIASKLILRYAQYGLVPQVIPPATLSLPLPTERIPVQHGTDLAYLQAMAARYAYVFYVTPGPLPLTNTAYWGPPRRVGVPQRALSLNLGQATNVTALDFEHNALMPTMVSGEVQDRLTNQRVPVRTLASTRPPLVSQPTWMAHRAHVHSAQLRAAGLSAVDALGRAQATTDASMDRVVTARGELNVLRYGDLLQAHELVGVRGAGYSYDGLYYVQSVTHMISRGTYAQRFTLTREGVGALLPVVRP